MADTLFGTETPAITDASDSAEYVLGTRFTPAVGGQATHGRWRFPDSAQPGGAQCRAGIYRVSDEVLLGQAIFSATPTLGDWNEVAFSPAIDLSAGVTYVVAVYTPGRYVATTSYPWPKTSGDLTAPSENGWLINAAGGLQYPSTQSGNSASFFADLVFEPDGGSVTGSGALTLPALTAAGAGIASSSGSGALTLPVVTASGAGTASAAGASDLILPALATSGAGTASTTGSGALTLPTVRITGGGGPPAPETSSPNRTLTSTSRARPLTTISRDTPLTTR